MGIMHLILVVIATSFTDAQSCEIFLDNPSPVAYFPVKATVNSITIDSSQGGVIQSIVLSSENIQNVNLGERSATSIPDRFGKATFEVYFSSPGRHNLFVNCGHSNASMSVLVALPSFNIDLITIVIVT